ncbi:DUF4012 domain-containing protein [Kineococcus gypseus]|uniref:DUF4012 domain-containing protein n=1 Tax=Kineococcus gypseus TaxID=1637102 RepID=UPI003D7EB85A
MLPETSPVPGAPTPEDPRRRRHRAGGGSWRRRLALLLGALAVLLLAEAVAVAVSGYRAARSLERVAQSAPVLVREVREQRFAEAAPVAARLRRDARVAARASGQWPCRLAERVPWVGDQLRAVRAAGTAAALLSEPLPQLLPVAEDLLGGGVVDAGRSVDVAALRRAAPLVQDLAVRARVADRLVGEARAGDLAAPLRERLDPVGEQLERVARGAGTAAAVVPALPGMLGGDGPRTYLVGFTNPAEIRTTQGIVGAYALLRLEDGRLVLERTGTDSDLYAARADVSALGAEYLGLYGDEAGRVQNVTLGAEAADAARLLSALWVDAGGTAPDAVALVDPVGLAHMLHEHEPLDLAGFGRVAPADLPDVLMHEAYVRFEGDQDARKAFLSTASAAAFEAVLADGVGEGTLRGAAEAVRTGHLALWSSRAPEQEALVAAGVAGDLGPQRPWARVGLTNADPSKLNYWTRAEVGVGAACPAGGGRATSRLSLRLVNPVPQEVPDYMAHAGVRGEPGRRTAVTLVSLHLPAGVAVAGAEVDGRPVAVAAGVERGWLLVRLEVVLPPGVPVEVAWRLEGPAELLPREVQPPATVAEPVVRPVPCGATG